MEPSNKPIVNPVAVLREEFDDWAVLYNPDTAEAVGVNPVGVVVWKNIDGTRDLDQLIARVRASFSEVPETVEVEVKAFIDDLEQRGLIGYAAQ